MVVIVIPPFTWGSPNFPCDLATIIETVASPVTFTTVLHISKGRSTAKISANPVSGIPACASTMTNMTIPAPGTVAEPIEAKVAVTIIPNWVPNERSIPNACAINTARNGLVQTGAVHIDGSPNGQYKTGYFFLTPRCSSTCSMVTGRVAALELVENANNCAGAIPLRKMKGLFGK